MRSLADTWRVHIWRHNVPSGYAGCGCEWSTFFCNWPHSSSGSLFRIPLLWKGAVVTRSLLLCFKTYSGLAVQFHKAFSCVVVHRTTQNVSQDTKFRNYFRKLRAHYTKTKIDLPPCMTIWHDERVLRSRRSVWHAFYGGDPYHERFTP